jgi:hypothetical protein
MHAMPHGVNRDHNSCRVQPSGDDLEESVWCGRPVQVAANFQLDGESKNCYKFVHGYFQKSRRWTLIRTDVESGGIPIDLGRAQFVNYRRSAVQGADGRSIIGILCRWSSKFYGERFPPCFGHTGMAF